MTDTTAQSSEGARHSTVANYRNSDQSRVHTGPNYGRFLAMVGTSTALMFALMYLNSYSVEHVYWSETRFYMTFVMGATMAIVMLSFMLGMYRNKSVNAAIFVGSAVLFVAALWLVRSQQTVQDESWMSAMIPHHSIAILTSERAEITDARVKELSEAIITAQNREISEMRFLLDYIDRNGEVDQWALGKTGEPAQIEGLQQAISTPEIAGIRPEPLTDEEIGRGLSGDPACTFVRAVNANPVLVTDSDGNGIAKVSGSLVAFNSNGSVSNGGQLTAEGGRMTVTPGDESGEDATLLFELTTEPALTVGFMGYWNCSA